MIPRIFMLIKGSDPSTTLGMTSDHKGGHETENCEEFRVCGINHGLGLHVVSLRHSDDTVGTYLSLTDCGEKADKTYAESYTEKYRTFSSEVLAEPHEEGHETVKALCGRHG